MKSFTDIEVKGARSGWAQEAMLQSRHDFTVTKVPLALPGGTVVPDKMATINWQTGEYLGTVGRGYTVVQPLDFYQIAQEFIDQTGATITRTMTMKGGAVLGINFLVNTREYLPGDPVEMNFLMMTAFDMSYSVLGRALSRRLFCLNQLPSSTRLFDVKHTTHAFKRLDMAMKMIAYFSREASGFDDKMKALTKYPMTEVDQLKFFQGLHPAPLKDSKRAKSILQNNTVTYQRLLHSGAGVDVPGVKGTAYHALNALTEFVNHFRGTRIKNGRAEDEVKFESTVFGSGNRLMQTGFNRLIDMTKHEPLMQDHYPPLKNVTPGLR